MTESRLMAFIAAATMGVAGLMCGSALGEPAAVAEPPAIVSQAKGTIDAKSQDLIDRFVEASGGAEVLKGIEFIHQTGTFEMPMAGLSGKTDTKIASDGRFIQSVDIPDFGLQSGGFDGTTGWMSDPMNGPQIVTGAMLTQMRRDSDMLGVLHYADHYASVSYEGEADFYDQKVLAIKLVDHEGKENTQFFSPETGLLVGQRGKADTPMGELEVSTEFKDYTKFGDLTVAKTILVHIGPMEQTMTIKTVEYGPIEDDAFAPPAAVQTLIAAEAEDAEG